MQSRSPRRDSGAGAVADDLHLDVPGGGQQLLDEEICRAERGRGLGRGPLESARQLVGGADDPHAPPAATRDRLEHDGGARSQRAEERGGAVEVDRPVGSGQDGYRHAPAPGAGPRTLSPTSSSTSAGGPTNVTPASAQARANAAFSDRKP